MQQRTQEQHPANDGITQKNEPSSAEPRFEYGKAQSSDPRSIRKNSNTHRKDAATVIQSYVVAWDVRSIKHPYPNQTFHLNIGLTHERNTITDLKKPTDCPVIQENFPELELRPALGFVSTAESCFHQFRDANKSDENIDLYLGEYVYSIDECFKLLEQKIITMQLEELEALKKLSTIIEDHLGQIQFESIVEDGVVHYESASQEVKVLVAEFRDKLGKRERVLINKMLSIDELSQSDLDKGRHKPDKLYNSDYDTFY